MARPDRNTGVSGDDLALWPDGTVATIDEVRAGEFDWMSDDYEIISHTAVARYAMHLDDPASC